MYQPLVDGEADARPAKIGRGTYMLIVVIFCAGMIASWMCALDYAAMPAASRERVNEAALLSSIPLVALLFTWFHIWLAIQMMFRPLKFFGIWQWRGTGVGLGWQGVVPRKAQKMAKTAFACARPYLLGPRDWLSRVDAGLLIAHVRPQLTRIVSSALHTVCARHLPTMDQRMPPSVREELVIAAVDKIEETSPEIWRRFSDILCDKSIGIDNDGMIVTVFMENKELLNHFFLTLGEKEFRFIEHCGAALGFVCGCVQLIAFQNLSGAGRVVFLPLTGFFLGIVTNWLAIFMCFQPCHPHPVYLCGRHLCDIQGLFLKRQKDVAVQYSKMLCDHFFNFSKVMAYLQTQPELWSALTNAYVEHNKRVLHQTLGSSVVALAPVMLGRQASEALEADLQAALVENMAKAEDMHQLSGKFIADATDIFRTNSEQMQRMPPDEFENLLHPVFKEDEWILVLLGGVLGAIVGYAQVHFLSQ